MFPLQYPSTVPRPQLRFRLLAVGVGFVFRQPHYSPCFISVTVSLRLSLGRYLGGGLSGVVLVVKVAVMSQRSVRNGLVVVTVGGLATRLRCPVSVAGS